MTSRLRVALATYRGAPSLAPDDRLLVPALSAVGIDSEAVVWSNESAPWETFDAVVVRSCWDYHLQIGDFTRWLDRLDAGRVPTWNSPSLILWNSHKRYLIDLVGRGIATIETEIVPRGRGDLVEQIVARKGWPAFVVKPAISASGYETHLLTAPFDHTTMQIVADVAALGDVLLQPFAPEVTGAGEYSLMFIDGVFSHSAIKRAKAGEFRVQTEHGGSVDPMVAPASVVQQAASVLDALPERPLYARVDGVLRGDRFVLMELELIEPNLFMGLAPGGAEPLAHAIARRLGASS